MSLVIPFADELIMFATCNTFCFLVQPQMVMMDQPQQRRGMGTGAAVGMGVAAGAAGLAAGGLAGYALGGGFDSGPTVSKASEKGLRHIKSVKADGCSASASVARGN